jgi:hypothetical protein
MAEIRPKFRAYFVLHPFESSPSAQNEGIVGSDKCDHINTFCLELVVLLEIWRQVLGVASRLRYPRSGASGQGDMDVFQREVTHRKRTGNAHKNNFLTFPFIRIKFDGYSAC